MTYVWFPMYTSLTYTCCRPALSASSYYTAYPMTIDPSQTPSITPGHTLKGVMLQGRICSERDCKEDPCAMYRRRLQLYSTVLFFSYNHLVDASAVRAPRRTFTSGFCYHMTGNFSFYS